MCCGKDEGWSSLPLSTEGGRRNFRKLPRAFLFFRRGPFASVGRLVLKESSPFALLWPENAERHGKTSNDTRSFFLPSLIFSERTDHVGFRLLRPLPHTQEGGR
ncbi:hypothetical protein R1flu_018722, partial [Riccia fluitans]